MSPRRRRSTSAIIAISALSHLVILALVGFSAPQTFWTPPDRSRIATVTLVRPVARRDRGAAPSPIPSIQARASVPGAPRSTPTPIPPTAAPSSPSVPAAAGGSSVAGPAPPPADDGRGGAQAVLRGLFGCDLGAGVHLTPEERARCADRFTQAKHDIDPLIGLDLAKRAAFDRQAAIFATRRAMHDGLPPDVIVSCGSPQASDWAVRGSNFGLGCLPDSAHSHTTIP